MLCGYFKTASEENLTHIFEITRNYNNYILYTRHNIHSCLHAVPTLVIRLGTRQWPAIAEASYDFHSLPQQKNAEAIPSVIF